MSRLADGAQTFLYRRPVAVDISTLIAAPGPNEDVTITVPADDELFWTTVTATGVDIRLCSADGKTTLTWQFNPAFNSSTRVCTLEVDNAAPHTITSMAVLWLYWGNTTVTTGAGAFVYAASKTGRSLVGELSRQIPHRFDWSPDAPGATKASPVIVKQATETILVAIRYRSTLAVREKPYAAGWELEEPYSFDYAVYDGASAQAGMIDATAIRLDEEYVYVIVKAGTTATDYTLRVTMVTNPGSNTGLGRTLTWSATVRVRTLTEG